MLDQYFSLEDVDEQQLYPGFYAKLVHSKSISVSYVRCDKGAVLPVHHHAEQQVLNLIEGVMDVTLDEVTQRCHPGAVVVIPSNTPHTVTAVTACLAIDIFTPVREAYRSYGVTAPLD